MLLDLVAGSYVGLFGFREDIFLGSSGGGGLISMARERRLADPGETGGFVATAGTKGAGSVAA
jgi:hypothetical protein